MKKTIIFIFLFAIQYYSYSQYGWIKIYNADTCGIYRFEHFSKDASAKKNIYFQFGASTISGPGSRALSWCRLNKKKGVWEYMPHNGFIHSNPFYCAYSQGWVNYSVTDFVISKKDSNLILQVRDVPPCTGGFPEPVQDTRITYNNGLTVINYPQFFNGFLGNQCGGFDIDPVNDSIIYFAYRVNSMFPCIYKTTNRGSNWFITDTVNFPSYGMLLINPFKRNEIYISGNNNDFYKSTSSGYNFFSVDNHAYHKLLFDPVDSSIYGITMNFNSGIYKSTNNGYNWSLLKIGNFRDIEIHPENHNILYAGSDSGLYRTSNGGINWILYNNSFSPSHVVIGVSKDPGTFDTLYVATYGSVYKVWGSWVGVTNISGSVPEKFSLNQNYPNPFNPSTKIKFDVKADGKGQKADVKLIIYNIQGKEITTLVNQQLNTGTYEVEWNGSNYPSGVYFYKLITEQFTETKRMVLMK